MPCILAHISHTDATFNDTSTSNPQNFHIEYECVICQGKSTKITRMDPLFSALAFSSALGMLHHALFRCLLLADDGVIKGIDFLFIL